MVQKLIELSLRNRLIVLLLAAGLFVWGLLSVQKNPIDAIPDLSENQVIVFTEWMGRSPQIIEDQVTYPLVSNLQGVPKVKNIRGTSMFGMSFWYTLDAKQMDLGEQRALQDWYIKFALQTVPGVAEVASFGGFEKQYQLVIDPNKLQYYHLS